MKKILILNYTVLLLILPNILFSENTEVIDFPKNIEYKIQPFYKYRPDGKPGREVKLIFKDSKLPTKSKLQINYGDKQENLILGTGTEGLDSVSFLLSPEVGVNQDADINLLLQFGTSKLTKKIKVPALRHWMVYIYPHSHVDIGYSNTHENVEIIHKWNIDEGIRLAEKTKDYPEGARYLWNTEVMWPFERYMKTASDEKKKLLIDAVKQGQICLDASYVHVNTSTCSEEELFQLFKYRGEIQKLTQKPMDVMIQVDIPGMSWGIVPVLAHEGIRYIMMMPNGTRGNQKMTYELNQKPFWWIGPDGKSKVLFLQPGSYGVGLGKGLTTGRPWFGQQDTARIPKTIKTVHPRKNFLDDHLFKTLPSLELSNHPYDIYVVTWALWDNAPLDADLPEAVKSWNEEYAYPRLVISNAHDIMQTFEQRYGDSLPVVKGDYTEYWTDNMGVAAKENGLNRNAKERLLQAETVWSMLHLGKPAPRAEFDEAWRNIILGSEHTYASENPFDPFFFNSTWNDKKSYFREGEERSTKLLYKALAPATDRSAGALGPVEGPSNGGVAVINTHSWNHGGLVTLKKIESQRGDRVIDDKGNEVRSQRLSNGDLVFLASDVPAIGSRHYRVVPGKCTFPNTCKYESNILLNGLVEVELDPNTGNIIGLTETASKQNYADAKKGLNTFIWQPAKGVGDAKTDSNLVITVKEFGPLLAEIQVSSNAPGCRSVVRRILLIHGQPWCEFSNTVDKIPLAEKDGIHFGYHFDLPESKARVDIPWGVMQLEEDQWPAANRAWMVTQHWIDISNKNKGVTWCSLDAPLFESGSITANNTAGWDGVGDVWPEKILPGSTIYSWVMNNHWYTNTPPTQDGPVTFRYRILPHGAYDAVSANRFGLEQAQPFAYVLCDKNPIEKPLVSINNDRVCVNVIKSSANGESIIVRIRSFSDKDENVKIDWLTRKPASIFLYKRGEESSDIKIIDEVIIPAMGFVTLKAEW